MGGGGKNSCLLIPTSTEINKLFKVIRKRHHCQCAAAGSENTPMLTATSQGNLEIIHVFYPYDYSNRSLNCEIWAFFCRKKIMQPMINIFLTHDYMEENRCFWV